MPARGSGRGGAPPPSPARSRSRSPSPSPSSDERYQAAKEKADDRAEKQLSNDLKLITPLADSSWATFSFQINQTVHRNSWAESVLNEKDAAGETLEIHSMTARNTIENYRLHKQISNAYQILTTKCEKHEISSSLAAVKIGDARGVWNMISEYFVRSTPAGRAIANRAFVNSTQTSTDSTLLQWFKIVDDLAADLAMARGLAVSDDEKKNLLLEGLLPEFEPKKLLIFDKGNSYTLTQTKNDLQDYAKDKGLMALRKGTSLKRNQSFSLDGYDNKSHKRKSSFQSKEVPAKKSHRENLADQSCKNWAEGTCRFGDKCYRKHDGPEGGVKKGPPPKGVGILPTPSPLVPSCHYCSNVGHAMKDCPDYKLASSYNLGQAMYASDDKGKTPNFSFPVMHEEELPDDEVRHHDGQGMLFAFKIFVVSLVASSFVWLPDFRRISNLKSCVPAVVICVIFACLASYAVAAPTLSPPSYVRTSSYFNSNGMESSTECEWVADTGTNRFVTNDPKDFIPGTVVHTPITVAVGGGTTDSPCSGSVLIFSQEHDITIRCDDVLLLPKCAKKLMPAHQFTKKGCTLEFGTEVHLRSKEGVAILSGPEIGGLFYFRARTVKNSEVPPSAKNIVTALFGLPASQNTTNAGADFPRRLLEAHWAYGHLSFDKLRRMLGLKKGNDPECPICTISKQKQAALADETKRVRSTRPCHRMHMDIGFTAGSDHVFALYVDDYHRVSYLDMLDSKSQSLEKWCDLKHKLENEFMPWKFAVIFTDSEPLYFTPGWEQHCKDEGLEHEFSSRHKHGQNGVVERAMQTVGTTFRCMMITGNAPPRCIPAALLFSNVIRNHSPTKANNGMTPLEKKHGQKLPINQRLLRGPLFCLVFAFVYETERIKHAPRGVPCVYLGYDPRNNTYLVMEWKSGREYYTADLQFHKTVFPFRANPDRTLPSLNVWDDIAPHATELIGPEEKAEQTESLRLADYSNKQLQVGGEGPGKLQSPLARQRLPSSQALKNIPDVDVAPDASTAYHLGIDSADVASIFVVQGYGPDPDSMEEALQMDDADQWILAELSEKQSWDAHDVVEIVPRSMAVSRGKRVFKSKAVLKKKFHPPDAEHPEGRLDKYKLRLTIAAYTRMLTEGIDYADKHASTVRWSAIKMIIAVAVKFDYDIMLLDISTFFLYGECKDEMYMEIPKGWGKDGLDNDSGHVFRLKKTVYGLPQASNAAQKELKGAFSAKGEFRSTSGDDCVYVPTSWGKSTKGDSTEGYSVCGTHVDDIACTGDSIGLKKIADTLEVKFKLTRTMNPTCITGIQIERVRGKSGWIKLHQTEYTINFLKEQKMEGARPVDTPMDPGSARLLMELPQDEFTEESIKLFQNIMGVLIWLQCHCRPDLDFAVNLGSRFLRCASQRHIDIVKGRILRYLNGTRDYGLVFLADEEDWILTGCSDADLAGDIKSARSTLSYNTRLGKFISSSSFLERKVCTSTGQAETYAYARLCREVIWERGMLREMGLPQLMPTQILTDNQGVLIQSEKSVNHSVAKHYRIAQAFIRQLVSSGVVKGSDVRSGDNCSDIGTKPLLTESFVRHRHTIMGPQRSRVDV